MRFSLVLDLKVCEKILVRLPLSIGVFQGLVPLIVYDRTELSGVLLLGVLFVVVNDHILLISNVLRGALLKAPLNLIALLRLTQFKLSS